METDPGTLPVPELRKLLQELRTRAAGATPDAPFTGNHTLANGQTAAEFALGVAVAQHRKRLRRGKKPVT